MRSAVFALLFTLLIFAFSTFSESKERTSLRTILKTVSQAVQRKAQGHRDLTHMVRVPSGGGMTYDFCQTTVDCKGDRRCVVQGTAFDHICSGQAECWCMPPSRTSCSRTSDCETGEVCSLGLVANLCESESWADDLDEPPLQAGLTYDDCVMTEDCEPPRLCRKVVNGNREDCAGRDGCYCLPAEIQTCTAHGECVFGEVCATVRNEGRSACLSESLVSSVSELVPVPRKLTFDSCDTGKDCEKPRECRVLNSNNDLRYCASRSGCFCVPQSMKTCERSQDCVIGEVCVQDSEGPFCVSQTYASQNEGVKVVDGDSSAHTPTSTIKPSPGSAQSVEPSPDSTPVSTLPSEQSSDDVVCIDAEALQGFGKADLVFEMHRQARVLCDKDGSCATPGHIVLFRGRGMMMRSYCDLASCKERVMMVNSPRYRRRLLVSSKTEDLYYTSFAARYETSGEEILLSALIRVGL